MMKRNVISVMVISALFAAGVASANGLSGGVGIASDHVFRGVSLSDEKASVNGDVTYTMGNLSFTGVATSTDLRSATNGQNRVKLDGIVNYNIPINDMFSASVGGVYYAFPNAHDLNTSEVNGSVIAKFDDAAVQVKTSYSDDYFGAGNSWYHEVNASYKLPYSMTAHAHYGRTTELKVNDYKVGVIKDFTKTISGELAWTDTNVNSPVSDSRITVAARISF
jgi:uncharacterized protein (TIGR02001 family)